MSHGHAKAKLWSHRHAGLAAIACLAAGWAWSGTALSSLTPARPVEVEFLNGSVRKGRLVGLTEALVHPVRIGRNERAPKGIRLLLGDQTVEVPPGEVSRIGLRSVEEEVIRTDAPVATLFLGSGPTTKVAEPAGWYLPGATVAGWKRAIVQHPSIAWRYIPRATWIWAERARHHGRNETVLFRHSFQLPEAGRIVSARLEVSADDHIESFFINGRPVHLPTRSLSGEVLQWDVTYLLQGGGNVVAARVTNQQSQWQAPQQSWGHENYAGFCYRIVCDLAPDLTTERTAPGVFLFMTNGDRLSADLRQVSPKQWAIRHGNRLMQVDPDWIELALMNYGNTIAPKSGFRPLALDTWLQPWKLVQGTHQARRSITLGPEATVAWSHDLKPLEGRQGVLLRNRDWIEGRIDGVRANRVLVKPRYGEAFGVAADRISLLQPNTPNPELQFQFRPSDFLSIVRLRLLNDDRITGALDSLTPTAITIRPLFSSSIRLDLDEVLSIEFIMNAASLYRERLAQGWPDGVPRQIAAIGAPERGSAERVDAVSMAVQRTLWNLGLDMSLNPLDANQIVEPGMLTPERFPVLLNLDQNELYFYSVRAKGDGYEAIRQYVRDGGTIVHLARGVPFHYCYVPRDRRWQIGRAPVQHHLNKALMMDFVTPDRRSRKARPFHVPDNRGQHMYFVLNRLSPFAQDLPHRVDLPMIPDMRFRPITDDFVTTPAAFFPVYRLADERGTDYGVAMALIRYGRGEERPNYGVYVSHLLAQASFRGSSMVEFILPKVLEIALGVQSRAVSLATMAIDSTGTQEHPAQAAFEPVDDPVEPVAPPPKPPLLPRSPK